MEGCRDTSFRVVGFGRYSLNSLVFIMSDVMHFMHESYLLSPYATCVWPGGYFDNKEFVLFCSVLRIGIHTHLCHTSFRWMDV